MTSSFDRRVVDALESAAQVLANCSAHSSAVGIFAKLTALEPAHSMGWYGIGEALFRQSAEARDLELLQLALACTRRALAENADNTWAGRLERTIETSSPLTAEQIAACQAFDQDPVTLCRSAGYSAARLAEDVQRSASWEERSLLMRWLGRHEDDDFIELLLRGARDENEQVQQAAIEQLRSRVGRADVRGCIEELARDSSSNALRETLAITLTSIHDRDGEQGQWARDLLSEMGTG